MSSTGGKRGRTYLTNLRVELGHDKMGKGSNNLISLKQRRLCVSPSLSKHLNLYAALSGVSNVTAVTTPFIRSAMMKSKPFYILVIIKEEKV